MINYLEKYLKYKSKYQKLKNIQKGGIPCTKENVFKNLFGTCWAVAVQMIITFGDVTSDNLKKTMSSFKVDGNYEHNINSKICFIKRQIERVQNDFELKQAFPTYIFDDGNISNLQNILDSFIDRYYSKVFTIKNLLKPKLNYKLNTKRCELVIAKNFKKLFKSHTDSYGVDIVKEDSDSYGAGIIEKYLFANILSTFFLGYKVSFTNYYENDFCKINYNDTTDIGILISIKSHACCFFICNGHEKYYNDNDKIIYDCKWKEQLKKSNGYSLYVKNKSCLILLNKESYNSYPNKNNISKVNFLTVVSKYKANNLLDNEIQKLINKTNLESINDKILQYHVGFYYNKVGNFIKSKKNYEKSAVQGNYSAAQYILGKIYEEGRGIAIAIDLIKAEEYYKLAADQNHDSAQYELGRIYEKRYRNSNSNIDLIKAKEYYELAADQNHDSAQYNLGRIYEEGPGTMKDDEKAFTYYKRAADQNNDSAQYNLGRMYENGIGTYESSMLAHKYYLRAADQNNVNALFKLGEIFFFGNLGNFSRDFDKALYYLHEVVNQSRDDNYYNACSYIGYILGNEKKKYIDAFSFVEIAADHGIPEAQYNLGNMYEYGLGTRVDYEEAIKYYQLAADNNHSDAQSKLISLCEKKRK